MTAPPGLSRGARRPRARRPARPRRPGALYSLGWCYEFVAYRLEKQPGRPYRDPAQLYELAAATLQRCIDLEPDPGLQDDAEKLRDTILDRL